MLGAASTYSGFLDEVESWRRSTIDPKEIFLVTFNYDTLLEDALTRSLRIEKQFKSVGDYVLGPFKVIKLHGSINWVHQVTRPPRHDPAPGTIEKVNDFIIKNITDLERNNYIAKDIRLFSGYSTVEWVLPALSIPVEQKAEYECPVDHQKALLDYLPHAKAIITIGWKAMEDSFVKLLIDNLRPNVNTLIVSRNQKSANDTADQLRDKEFPGKIIASSSEGFSAFTREEGATEFLVNTYRGSYRKEYVEE